MSIKTPKEIVYGPAIEREQSHGHRNVRWIENVSRGLRFVGFADKILKLDHNGWYTRDDGLDDEVYRGIVYQLPSRDGCEQFVYGYADPNNDDCALLAFEPATSREEAARWGDDLAMRFAEGERDFHRAWDAGARYRDLGDEVKTTRREALALGAEIRIASKAHLQVPTICTMLRRKVLSLYQHIQKLRRERAELMDNYGREAGFVDAMGE